MKQTLSITRKELSSYFGSPMALIFLGALGLVTAFCWRFHDVIEGRVPERFPWALFGVSLVAAAAPFVRAAAVGLRLARGGTERE